MPDANARQQVSEGEVGPGKAARNEGRKLMAAWLNGVSIAAVVAGFFQPLLATNEGRQSVRLADLSLSLMLFAISFLLILASQAVVRRVED
jgi:dipeptide/tripeptide permease